MKKWFFRLFTALLIALLIGGTVVYFAPATWLAHGVAHITNGRVLLTEAQGSVFEGSAGIALSTSSTSSTSATTSGAYPLPSTINWRVDWPSLLTGTIQLHVDSAMFTRALDIESNGFFSGIFKVSANQISIPIAVLNGLGAPFNTLQLQGQMSLRFDDTAIDSQSVRSHAVLQLNGLSSRLSSVSSLGNYLIQIESTPTPAADTRFTLTTPTGPLFMNATGGIQNGRFHLNGEAYADPAQEAALSGLLGLLGRRQGNKIILAL